MNKNGFTLIELIIAVVIIAILASIAIPSYQNYITRSKIKEAQSNLIALSLSAENNYQRTLNYPTASLTTSSALVANTVFKSWAPSSNAFEYKYVSTDGSTYTLTATGNETKVSGCTLTLNNQSVKTISGCGAVTEWMK